MRIPRDVSGDDLIKRLNRLGYEAVRQSGSHTRLVRTEAGVEQRVTVPRHAALRVGTLNSICNDVALHLEMTKQELMKELFG